MIAARAHTTCGQVSPPVWRILLHSSVFGLALSVADLLFNFYLVSLGYTSATVGLFSTVSRAAGVLAGIPLGMMIDRIGPQKSILIGLAVYGIGWAIILQFTSLWVMVPLQFLIGGAYILTSTAVMPLLAGVTHDGQRAMIFGWNASATLVVGLAGSALGGILPTLAAGAIGVGPQDTAAYRLALTVIIALSVIAMLPVIERMQTVSSDRPVGAPPVTTALLPLRTLARLGMSSLLLGFGGGAFLPFQNLYFRSVFGMGDASVGVVLACAALSMGVGGLLGAPVARRLGLRRAAALLRLCVAPAMLLMLVPSLITASVGFFLRGLFVAASFPLNDALVMRATPLRQRGMAASITNVLWAGGWAGAAWASGAVQERWGFAPVIASVTVAYLFSSVAIFTLPVIDQD